MAFRMAGPSPLIFPRGQSWYSFSVMGNAGAVQVVLNLSLKQIFLGQGSGQAFLFTGVDVLSKLWL